MHKSPLKKLNAMAEWPAGKEESRPEFRKRKSNIVKAPRLVEYATPSFVPGRFWRGSDRNVK
jgi:hypothetical protein